MNIYNMRDGEIEWEACCASRESQFVQVYRQNERKRNKTAPSLIEIKDMMDSPKKKKKESL